MNANWWAIQRIAESRQMEIARQAERHRLLASDDVRKVSMLARAMRRLGFVEKPGETMNNGKMASQAVPGEAAGMTLVPRVQGHCA